MVVFKTLQRNKSSMSQTMSGLKEGREHNGSRGETGGRDERTEGSRIDHTAEPSLFVWFDWCEFHSWRELCSASADTLPFLHTCMQHMLVQRLHAARCPQVSAPLRLSVGGVHCTVPHEFRDRSVSLSKLTSSPVVSSGVQSPKPRRAELSDNSYLSDWASKAKISPL